MDLDQNRLKTILERDHSFYGLAAVYREDERLLPGTQDFILTQFKPDMRVLDVGCGNGATLTRAHNRFEYGLGIDKDPEHLRMAEDKLKESGATNVEFRLLDFEENPGILEPESFDFVFSERGPMDNSFLIRAALETLRPGGLLFNEVIGKHHLHEVFQIFKRPPDPDVLPSEQILAEMERNGVDIRIVADLYGKRIYPDVYEWLQFQCSIWSYIIEPFPEPDDPRIRLFAEQNALASGEIKVTHHVTWIGGVKRQRR
jgi:SAM-dependent methyltransferase